MSEDLHRYVCQQCKQPLRIDPELVDLPPSAYGIIEGSVSQPNSPASRNVAGPKSAKSAKSATMSKAQAKQPVDSSGPGESFVLLRDSVIHSTPKQRSSPQQSPRRLPNEGKTTSSPRSPPAPLPETQSKVSLSHQIRSHTQLFNFLSSRTEIDHPLCAECTHVLLTSLTRQLEEMKKERDGYLAFEKEIRKEKERESDADNAKIDSRIRELKSQEQGLVKELKQLDSDRLSLEKELQALELEEKLLEEEEDQ
ncbi:APG6-domain-containing protein [Sistotremastrum suecicum HHB10207 ss-3]|uniref:APG6-domain-containing protein n=1 Tax=Sistotremastrum suecicum HHB10207 ss-3 TaxID=1314776 RepID=A0A166H9U9_9AGAM|nr:APG6-domain-containing protein [Sistotremastrum suecicum HHB10207 ss-3]